MANQELMTFVQFQKEFNSEEACHQHLFQKKWEKGFECPKCKHTHAYEIKTRKLPLYVHFVIIKRPLQWELF